MAGTDQTNRFQKLILNPKTVTAMCNEISRVIKRPLEKAEVQDFMEYLRNNRTKNWNMHTYEKIQRTLVQNYVVLKYSTKGRNSQRKDTTDVVDIHEVMKLGIGTPDQDADESKLANVNADGIPVTRIIPGTGDGEGDETDLGSLTEVKSITSVTEIKAIADIKKILGKGDDTSFQRLVNPEAANRKNYIMLDTRHRLTDTDGTQEQAWNFLSGSTVNAEGVVNSLGNVKNVVSVQVFPIKIPFKSSIVANAYGRVSMLVKEWQNQAFVGQEGRNFHFMFSATVNGNMIDLVPLADPTVGIFEFAKPITSIDKLTVTWGSPLEPITFDLDRMNVTIGYTNPATFTTGVPHNLLSGDQVYFQTFTTNNPGADNAIIAQTNQVAGFNVVVTSTTSFQILELDYTAIPAPNRINPLVIQSYFGSKRIMIPLCLKYVGSDAPT